MSFSFRYPANMCSRCGSVAPVIPWKIYAARVRYIVIAASTTTYSIDVPVCQSCHDKLQANTWKIKIVSVVISVILFVILFLSNPEYASLALLISIFIGLMAYLIAGRAFVDRFAKLSVHGGNPWIEFKHPQYNALFTVMNGRGRRLR